MEDLYNKASLVLTPQMVEAGKVYSMKPEDRKGDFTFSRSTAATRVNASGNIEKETGNLLANSSTFTSWIKSSIGVTLTSGQSGYDGSSDAYQIEKDANGFRFVRQDLASPTGVVTFSVYMKAGTLTTATIRLLSSPDARANFNLNTGALISSSNVIDTSSEDVGNGWYRYSMTANMTTMAEQVIYPDDITTSNAGTIFVQDAQLERGLVARDYVETTTTATYGGITDNVPRLDYTDSSCPALLLEPQRTNIVPISEGVPEGTNNVTLTENYATSPEGAQNSLKVQKNGVDSNDRIQPIGNYNATLISGNDYTISCFVKNIDSTNAVTTLACRVSGGSLFRSGYDWDGSSLSYLATGYNAGTRKNIFVEDYGNGWWRIGFTFEANGTSGNFELDIDRRNGSNTTSIETWGWQLEQGSFATSYIPTYGSAVTRNADACQVENKSALINSEQGTMYFEGIAIDPSFANVLSFSDGTNNNRISLTLPQNTTNINAFSSVGGSKIDNYILHDPSINSKYAIVWNGNSFKVFVNGVKKLDNTMAGSFSANTLTDIRFDRGDGGLNFGGFCKLYLSIASALTDQEAIDLTTI